MKQYLNYYYWFSQPSIILDRVDKILGLIFLLSVAAGVLFLIFTKFNSHVVKKKLFQKISALALTIGVSGFLWVGFRYENVPIFSYRYWSLLILLIGVVWKVFILKYLFFRFMKEKIEFEKNQIKKRYLP